MTDLLDLIADQQATLALIAGDPLHARDRAAIVEAIQVRSTDRKGKNAGKPTMVYRWAGASCQS